MIIYPKEPSAVQMSKYPQNTILVKITYSWMDRGHRTHTARHTFAPVDLTAPKVAAGKNLRTSYTIWMAPNINHLKHFISQAITS